ncbi:MAG: hypothetical protein VW683_16695 [Betaproteobacteria bacterium]
MSVDSGTVHVEGSVSVSGCGSWVGGYSVVVLRGELTPDGVVGELGGGVGGHGGPLGGGVMVSIADGWDIGKWVGGGGWWSPVLWCGGVRAGESGGGGGA